MDLGYCRVCKEKDNASRIMIVALNTLAEYETVPSLWFSPRDGKSF
jgi:hypothetical protein